MSWITNPLVASEGRAHMLTALKLLCLPRKFGFQNWPSAADTEGLVEGTVPVGGVG